MSEEKIILPKDVVLTRKMVEVYDIIVEDRNGPSLVQCSNTTEDEMRERVATHTECTKCQKPAKKPYLLCEECQKEKNTEAFNNYEEVAWTQGMAFSKTHNEYYQDWDEVFYKLADMLESDPEFTIQDMRLVIADPVYPRQLNDDFFSDEMPDDMEELPDNLQEAIDAFNDVIKAAKPLSYEGYHSKIRVKITEDILKDFEDLKKEILNKEQEELNATNNT